MIKLISSSDLISPRESYHYIKSYPWDEEGLTTVTLGSKSGNRVELGVPYGMIGSLFPKVGCQVSLSEGLSGGVVVAPWLDKVRPDLILRSGKLRNSTYIIYSSVCRDSYEVVRLSLSDMEVYNHVIIDVTNPLEYDYLVEDAIVDLRLDSDGEIKMTPKSFTVRSKSETTSSTEVEVRGEVKSGRVTIYLSSGSTLALFEVTNLVATGKIESTLEFDYVSKSTGESNSAKFFISSIAGYSVSSELTIK